MITTQETEALIKKFGKNSKDSGSTEVQVAIISTRIKNLAVHFEKNKKDNSSMRGLMLMIGQRRRLLNYLQKSNNSSYLNLIKELGLRK